MSLACRLVACCRECTIKMMTAHGSCHHDVHNISNALGTILRCQRDIIDVAKSDIADFGAKDFVANKIKNCFKLASVYDKAFHLIGVPNIKEFNQAVSHCFSNEMIRDQYEASLENEKEWDEILNGLDLALMTTGKSLQVGDMGPTDLPVVNVVSGAQTTLRALPEGKPTLLSEFKAKDWNILIVSFGAREGAEKWIKDTHCPFEVVVDEQRQIYHAFGLYRSVSKVWNFGYMAFYGEQMKAGRPLPKPYEHISDDPMQMGGDFLLDSDGIVRMTHPSETPTDRPTCSHLLSITATSHGTA